MKPQNNGASSLKSSMKYILSLTAICLVSVLPAAAQEPGTLEALSEKYGFRDAHFEAPLSSFKDMVLLDPRKSSKVYYRRSDSRKIGGAEVKGIYYTFYKGRLSSVSIITKGIEDSRALLAALQAQYGPGEQANERIEKYEWPANRVKMVYDQNIITDDATVLLISTYMAHQQGADNAAAAKRAGSDL
jgi:hypothetical protein